MAQNDIDSIELSPSRWELLYDKQQKVTLVPAFFVFRRVNVPIEMKCAKYHPFIEKNRLTFKVVFCLPLSNRAH